MRLHESQESPGGSGCCSKLLEAPEAYRMLQGGMLGRSCRLHRDWAESQHNDRVAFAADGAPDGARTLPAGSSMGFFEISISIYI